MRMEKSSIFDGDLPFSKEVFDGDFEEIAVGIVLLI